jgi:hypothetical protein
LFTDVSGERIDLVGILNLEDGTDMLSRNVGKNYRTTPRNIPKKAQISSTSRRKPEIKISGHTVLPGFPAVDLNKFIFYPGNCAFNV